MKKIILTLILLFPALLVSANYSAINYSNTPLEAANSLALRWIINDHSKNPTNYNLDSYVLRQEIAAVSRWVAWLPRKNRCENIFSDVSATVPNDWACFSIEVLIDNDLIARNTTFRPEDHITKAESIWMLIRSIWFDYRFDWTSSKTWQEQIVDYAFEKWVIKDRFSDFDSLATRWWIFLIADTTIKRNEEIKIQERIEKWIYSDEVL